MLDRHLRLVTVKCQTAELLLKSQVVQNAMQRSGSNPGVANSIPTRPALPPPTFPLQGTVPIFVPTKMGLSPLPESPGEHQDEGGSIMRYPFPLSTEESDDDGGLPFPFPLPVDSAPEAETGNPSSRDQQISKSPIRNWKSRCLLTNSITQPCVCLPSDRSCSPGRATSPPVGDTVMADGSARTIA